MKRFNKDSMVPASERPRPDFNTSTAFVRAEDCYLLEGLAMFQDQERATQLDLHVGSCTAELRLLNWKEGPGRNYLGYLRVDMDFIARLDKTGRLLIGFLDDETGKPYLREWTARAVEHRPLPMLAVSSDLPLFVLRKIHVDGEHAGHFDLSRDPKYLELGDLTGDRRAEVREYLTEGPFNAVRVRILSSDRPLRAAKACFDLVNPFNPRKDDPKQLAANRT